MTQATVDQLYLTALNAKRQAQAAEARAVSFRTMAATAALRWRKASDRLRAGNAKLLMKGETT